MKNQTAEHTHPCSAVGVSAVRCSSPAGGDAGDDLIEERLGRVGDGSNRGDAVGLAVGVEVHQHHVLAGIGLVRRRDDDASEIIRQPVVAHLHDADGADRYRHAFPAGRHEQGSGPDLEECAILGVGEDPGDFYRFFLHLGDDGGDLVVGGAVRRVGAERDGEDERDEGDQPPVCVYPEPEA